KRCSMCKEIKPATKEHFNHMNITRRQLHSRCKACNKIYIKQLYASGTRIINFPDGAMKQCSFCKQSLPATIQYFYKRRIMYGGLSAMCRPCWRFRNRTKYQNTAFHPVQEMKKCSHCQQVKPATTEYFHMKKTDLYGVASICKVCVAAYNKRYQHEHREKLRVYYHKYRVRMRSNGGSHTIEDIRQQYKRQKGL